MKIYPVLTKEGQRTSAFEVENVYISLTAVARLLASIEGVTEVQPRKMFAKSSDVHLEFKFLGQPYMVWEPYGDSSRYWIGPKDEVVTANGADALEDAFKHYKPTVYRTILGEVLTLRFIRRAFGG